MTTDGMPLPCVRREAGSATPDQVIQTLSEYLRRTGMQTEAVQIYLQQLRSLWLSESRDTASSLTSKAAPRGD
jgi:hypothetical protein